MKFFDFEILLFHLFSQTWRLRQIIHLVGKKSDEKNGGCFLLAISFLEGSFCKSPGGNPLKRLPNPWAKVCDSGTYQTTISCFALPSVQNHWALVKRLSSLLPLKFLTARTAISPACCKVFQKASWIYAYVIVVCESNVFLWSLSKKWGSHANCPVLCKEWWIPFGDFLKISRMLRKNIRIFVKTSKISEKKLSDNTLQKGKKKPTKLQELHRTSTKSTLPQWLERSTSQPWRKHWKQKWYPNG